MLFTMEISMWLPCEHNNEMEYLNINGKTIYRKKDMNHLRRLPGGNYRSNDVGKSVDSKTKDTTRNVISKSIYNDVWCDETRSWKPKEDVIKLKRSIGSRLIRNGNKYLNFVIYPWRGQTAVRIYRKKDGLHLSTKFFDGPISPSEARELLFTKATGIKTAKKKGTLTFKAIYRNIILPTEEFNNKFKPNNHYTTKYQLYTNADTAVKSMSNIISMADGEEVTGGTASAVLKKCSSKFREHRNSYSGPYPCVEVIAVWINFDPESNLIHEEYDSWEPIHYSYNRFNNKLDMMEYPL